MVVAKFNREAEAIWDLAARKHGRDPKGSNYWASLPILPPLTLLYFFHPSNQTGKDKLIFTNKVNASNQ